MEYLVFFTWKSRRLVFGLKTVPKHLVNQLLTKICLLSQSSSSFSSSVPKPYHLFRYNYCWRINHELMKHEWPATWFQNSEPTVLVLYWSTKNLSCLRQALLFVYYIWDVYIVTTERDTSKRYNNQFTSRRAHVPFSLLLSCLYITVRTIACQSIISGL